MPKVRGKGDEAKRHNVSLRVTPAIMERLDAAIAENGRSLAQELETRVAQTFQAEDELGGPSGVRLHRLLAQAIRMVEEQTGASVQEDFRTWKAARAAIDRTMAMFCPPLPNSDEMKSATDALSAAEAEEEKLKTALEVLSPPAEATVPRSSGMMFRSDFPLLPRELQLRPPGAEPAPVPVPDPLIEQLKERLEKARARTAELREKYFAAAEPWKTASAEADTLGRSIAADLVRGA